MVVHPRSLLPAALTALLTVGLLTGGPLTGSALADQDPTAGQQVAGAATSGSAAEHDPVAIDAGASAGTPAAAGGSLIQPRTGTVAEGPLQGSDSGSAAQLAAFPLGLLAVAAGALAFNARREA